MIERVINHIVEKINPERIILFGSAQGNESLANDLDLLVVSEPPPGKNCRDLSRDLHGLFEGWFLPLDIIVLTPENFEKGKEIPGHIARTAQKEGKVVYGSGIYPKICRKLS